MTDTRVKFQKVWDAHPMTLGEHDPCRNEKGDPAFGNQCAIRMGIALLGAGIKVPASKSVKHCWYKGHQQHCLLAEQLAGWILLQKPTFGAAEKRVGKKWDATNGVDVGFYKGRKGIIFFKDFWARAGENEAVAPTGDHIDVWDGAKQGSGSDNYFERSKQLWFWELP